MSKKENKFNRYSDSPESTRHHRSYVEEIYEGAGLNYVEEATMADERDRQLMKQAKRDTIDSRAIFWIVCLVILIAGTFFGIHMLKKLNRIISNRNIPEVTQEYDYDSTSADFGQKYSILSTTNNLNATYDYFKAEVSTSQSVKNEKTTSDLSTTKINPENKPPVTKSTKPSESSTDEYSESTVEQRTRPRHTIRQNPGVENPRKYY